VTLSRPSELRVLPVRLDRIRPDVRYRAALEYPGDGAVLHAALYPSDTVFYVALEAWPILKRVAA
jgi:hypothetical protein